MAVAGRTFRIFVSSTFSDLKAERDALQQHVFPRLRDLCERNGARFQAIDLRWGVSEEAGLDQRTIPICLTEIKRCQRTTPRPNFIVLLGDRYGWRPLPARVDAEEFEEILGKLSDKDRELLLWSEDQPDDWKGWYRFDTNAVPAEYRLRPRVIERRLGETEEEAQDREDVEWRSTEKRLRSILLGAIERLEWTDDDPRLQKYTASATELEIVDGALDAEKAEKAEEHVFAFLRTIRTKEGRRLADDLPQDGSAKDFVDQLEVDEGYAVDQRADELLATLKDDKLKPLLGDHVHEYEVEWTGSGITTGHLDALCGDVWWRLARMIGRQIRELAEVQPLEREIAAHRAFGAGRIEFEHEEGQEPVEYFAGRESDVEAIRDYVDGGGQSLLAVVGDAGSGKSALMAKAAKEAEEKAQHSGAAVVVRFIGATPTSSDGRALLGSLCRQISAAYGAEVSDLPTDYRDLVVEFRKRLELAQNGPRLIVFLDALDQLSDAQQARNLAWLPGNLPDNVRVVVSALPGECEDALARKYPAPRFLRLGRMSRKEGERVLRLWLENERRTLQEHQERELLDRFESSGGLPLYLKLAFEEARLWHSYDDPVLHEGTEALIRDNLFSRLAEPSHHGYMLVSRSLGYLAASRYGLSEDELVDVLSADRDVKKDFRRRAPRSPDVERLPVVVWSRLHFDLEPYLGERSADGTSLLAFYHRQLEEVARAVYLAGGKTKWRHRSLAEYFRGKSDPADDRSWTGGSERGLSELPYHFAEAERLDDLFETLTDFRFLEHKAAEVGVVEQPGADGSSTQVYTGVFQLQDDFELALTKFGGGEAAARKPLIVTAVDFRDGNGYVVRCPWCNTVHVFDPECPHCRENHDLEEWRGSELACPREGCNGPLKVNTFIVPEQPGGKEG